MLCDPSWSPEIHRQALARAQPYAILHDDANGVDVRLTGHQSVVSPSEGGVIFTSGTSGHPKQIVHGDWFLDAPYPDVPNQQQMWFSGFPFCSIAGHTILTQTLVGGHTLVTTRVAHPRRVLELLTQYEIDVATMGADLLRLVVRVQRAVRVDRPPRLRMIAVGGSRLDPEVARAAAAMFNCTVVETYGTTELGGGVAVTRVYASDGSVSPGFPLGGVEISLRDPDGDSAAAIGEITCRSPRATLSAEDDASAPFLSTGDLGVYGEGGGLSVLGRSDSIIVRSGRKVSAERIEQMLERHEHVDAACAVSVPDTRRGAAVLVFVECGDAVDEGELWGYLRRVLTPDEQPDLVRCVNALPRSSTGKVKRSLLAALGESTVVGHNSLSPSRPDE